MSKAQTFGDALLQLIKSRDLMDAHVALVSAAALDECLGKALLTKFRPLNKKMRKKLFEWPGPLSNFSTKIDLAFALNVFEKITYDDLKTMNKNQSRICSL